MNRTANGIISCSEANALPADCFEWLFINVVEHCPEAAKAVAAKRPFLSSEAIKVAFEDYLENLDKAGKEAVLKKHPDLAGKLADEKKLTAESQNEQKLAGLESMAKEEKQILIHNKYLYKEKFKFPFVICARENDVQSILQDLERRLRNNKETELQIAIKEVKKICRMRIDDIVWH